MYCLEKLQRELAHFLKVDLNTLPKVQEILQSQGYNAVKKNDEIIELGSGKNPKQKTIEKVDFYANTDEFKALSKDKQEAILSLKSIEPSPMPQEISIKDLEHLSAHFESKLDKEQREKLLTLFKDTKENPHIVLEVLKNGETRQEYIKAYQHKESKDLYYLAISKDQRDITGIPTTKLIKVINDIAKSKKVVRAVNFEGISNTATPLPKQTSPQRSSEIIPQPNKQTFESFKQSLEAQGIPIESEVKSFINFVEKNIYDEKGVSFNQLNNALKTLNSYYKEAKDPNFKNHIKNAMDSFLREDIKAGIEAIFSQNKTAYKDINSLYASALSDYADMKEVLKIADKLKIRNATTEQNKALDSLLKLAKGQGDKQDNISQLTKALNKDNRALIELNMLQSLFQKSLYDDNALQVIDSEKFFKELKDLHKDTFQSKEAQDFINIMSDFDKLFKNDILIAKALKPTTTGQISSSIATSIEGAVKFQVVKSAFSHLVRLMPHIPFMGGLNQKVQGTALRYHLQKALENSFSVSDLKHTLQNTIAKAPYTSQTKSQIDKILNRVDKAQDELIEVAERNALTTQRKNILDKLQYLKGKQATNKTDGRIAYVSKDGLEKMLSRKAIGKSLDNGFSLENHLQAVENVLDLFTNAIFMQSQKPNNNSADIIAFHKYLAPFENADVKLTIKEINQNGNKIYSLESLEMSPVLKRNLPNANTQEAKDIIHTGGDRLSETSTPTETPSTIPQTKQETQEILPSENIFVKAQQEREAQEVAKQIAEQEALKAQKAQAQEFRDRALRIIAQKEANAGKNVLEQEITQGGAIPLKEVGNAGSVSINDDNIYKLQYVVVKGKDLKPNFESNSLTQTRTTHNQEVIENIAKNFNADKVIGRGGFDDVPIILRDGQIISGNHRTQGMLQFTPESREAYERAIKEAHNIDLAPDELLMRIPQKELTSNQLTSQEIRALAGVSNKARESNEGDKIINSLGEYAGNIKELSGKVLQAENADEMALFVARALDKQSKSPNVEATNKALLAYNTPSNENLSLSDVFNKMQKDLDLQDFNTIKDMYIKTAGAWHNLSNDVKLGNALGLDSLNLKPYLLYAIESSARFLNRARSTNFSYFNTRLQELMQTTDEKGLNPLLAQSPTFYDNLIGDILGASLARYARLENPTDNLFETLINTKKALQEQVAPTLMGEGKSLKEADIFDFIEYIIAQGESSEQSGRLIGFLPSLREKYNAFNKAMQEPSPTPQANAPKGEIKSAPQTSEIIFTDKKGKEHTLTQEVQEQWLNTFNLKSLDESYIPKLPQGLQEAIGKEIRLTKGSLYKIVEKGRGQYIPQIKETLEKPQIVLQDESELIFAKQIKDDLYLTSIGKDFDTHITIISNSPKTDKTIQNKLKNGKMIYKAENAEALPTSGAFTETNQVPISNTIIPQQANTSDMLKTELKEVQDLKAQYTSLQEKHKTMKNKRSQESEALKEQIETLRGQWLNKKREAIDSGNKKELESLNLIQSKALTSENAGTNAKESPVTSLNQDTIIPQMPKDNNEPEKILEYFKDDFMQGYIKARNMYEGHAPMTADVAYKALEPIETAQNRLEKEADESFREILQKAGYPKDVIQENFINRIHLHNKYGYHKLRSYFNMIEKDLHGYDEVQKPIAEKLLKQKDKVLDIYASRLQRYQELEKKRLLLSIFADRARDSSTKEKELLKKFIDDIEAKTHIDQPQPQRPYNQKSLFDEVDSSLSKEIKDIIDSSPEKGRDMQIIGEANFTPQVVEYAHKNNKKVAIDKLKQTEAQKLGFKHPQDVRVTIDYQAINHTLNRHGADSALVQQSGQKAVDYTDIAEYRSIVKGADESLESVDNLGQEVIVSFKQINGHAIVVESVRKKGNELAFKSMYFENGSYKNSNVYKNAVKSPKGNPSPAPYGYEPHADASTPPKVDADIIPQQANTSDMLKTELKEVQDLKAQYTSLQEKHKTMKNKRSQESEALKEQIETLRGQWLNKKREAIDKQNNFFTEFAKHIVKDDKAEQIIKQETNESIQALEREIKKAKEQGYEQSYYKTELQNLEYYKKILTQPESYARAKEMRMQELGNSIRLLKTISYTQDTKYTEAQKNKLRQELELYFDIHPIQEFGTNYAEHYRDGVGAIEKLLNEKQGQVSGAFYRKELGDIDVVWGDDKIGLQKIVDKHLNDFTDFKGDNPYKKMSNAINEIVANGKVVSKNGVDSIVLHKNGEEYRIGISKGWDNVGDNKWIITSYKKNKDNKVSAETSYHDTFTPKEPLGNLDNSIIPQTKPQMYNDFNQSLKDAYDFFKANNKDPYNDKLFDDVIKVANALDIRFWYQPNAVYMAGSYTYTLNRIMLKSNDFSKENAKTILHELIHSVTSRAIYAYDNKALRAKLSKEQIEAIAELKNLYKEVCENNADKVWQKMATFKDEIENNQGKLYGLRDEHEMLAELANPSFREFLKEQNIFSKIIEAMAKIFSYVKDKLTGGSIKSTNAHTEIESILYKIMDNYTNPHAFTNEMSEHFGSRNFVDTARYKEYIKDHKEKFDKDNYKGKHIFSFTEGMNFYTRSAISGKEKFFKNFINNAYFDERDFDKVQKLKWQMMDPTQRPDNFMELKTEKNAHIFEMAEQAHENNLKSFVPEYYKVSYDEFNNAFNGAMKDKHFYEVKASPLETLRDATNTETKILLALKPYFTSGLYKVLNEGDFNVIKDSLYRILQDENLTYRNKPINEWFAKEWVENDVKNLQESFQYKLENIPNNDKQ